MPHSIPLKSADEYDALTKSGRRVHLFAAGVRKAIKARFNRRLRKAAKDIEYE